MSDHVPVTHVIAEREFENSAAEMMARVKAGDSVIVTEDGVGVAELRPVRPPEIRKRRVVPKSEALRAFADLPPMDYARWRADDDAAFGEERLDDE